MPLRTLRPNTSNSDLRRRSTLDIFRRPDATAQSQQLEPIQSPSRGAHSQELPRKKDVDDFDPSWSGDGPPSPPVQEENQKTKRFSIMKFRHASDGQLSRKAKEHAPEPRPAVPPLPSAPQIITTAPTMEPNPRLQPRKKKTSLFSKSKNNSDVSFSDQATPRPPRKSTDKRSAESSRKSMFGSMRNTSIEKDEPGRLSVSRARGMSSDQTDTGNSSSSGEHPRPATSRTTATPAMKEIPLFQERRFKLPRRSKTRASLFPLPVKIPPPAESQFPNTAPATPRQSTSALHSPSGNASPGTRSPEPSTPHGEGLPASDGPSHVLAASSVTFAAPATPLLRNDSSASKHSSKSTPAAGGPTRLGLRGRSSTLNSTVQNMEDQGPPTPPLSNGGRNSTSTAGRSSLSTFFSRGQRYRGNSDSPRHGSPSHGPVSALGSKNNSMSISREALVIPAREEGETPPRYLERMEETCPKHMIAGVLSKTSDQFQLNVLRSFMRKFMFFQDPLDMAIRKLLMAVELPAEAQHIDRVLEAFANRYHECNPGIFPSPDSTHFITFSIVVLHTDFFNSNNKRKMQRNEYIKNSTRDKDGSDCSEDVLGYFYDNIVYTRFISFFEENDLKLSNLGRRGRKAKLKGAMADPVKKVTKEPIDPYEIIIENNMDALRPPLKNTMLLDDPFSYKGSAKDTDIQKLQKSFCRCGVIQILSSRSRPEAFMDQSTIENPAEAQAGVVDIPITKIGIIWRKDAKKKKTRSPWSEWGVILTSTGVSFFRNAGWVKSLMHQLENHRKAGHGDDPVIFKPPLETFKSDQTLTLSGAVALTDSSYRRHKHAMLLCSKTVPFEYVLADDEAEMNDWISKINYSATFQTVNVRPRGIVGSHYEGQKNRGIRRMESSNSTRSVQTPTGEVQITSGKIDNELRQQMKLARKELIETRVFAIEERIVFALRSLDILLRDARHIQLLAPVQAKTREEIVHAAARLGAQIRWARTDIARMKCHRELLILDVEDEKRSTSESAARIQRIESSSGSPSTLKPNKTSGLARLNSKASSVFNLHRPPHSPSSQRPATKSSLGASETAGEDVFKTPPESARSPRPGSWELPPLDLGPETSAMHRGSIASMLTSSPILSTPLEPRGTSIPAGSEAAVDDGSTSDENGGAAFMTPPDEESEPETARQFSPPAAAGTDEAASVSNAEGEDAASEAGPADPSLPGPQSPGSRSRVRRSLHRTLREAREVAPIGYHAQRGKRANQSISSAATDDISNVSSAPDSEVLSRNDTHFTVHGKKASIITFGSDWQNMSAEERLKVRKQATSDDSAPASGKSTDLDSGPATAIGFPREYRASSLASPMAAAFEMGLPTSGSKDSKGTDKSTKKEDVDGKQTSPVGRQRRLSSAPATVLNETRKYIPKARSEHDNTSDSESESSSDEDDEDDDDDTEKEDGEVYKDAPQVLGKQKEAVSESRDTPKEKEMEAQNSKEQDLGKEKERNDPLPTQPAAIEAS